MRVAVWRYGMALQLSDQSTVGGGLLSGAVLSTLVEAGHEVDVVGPVVRGTELKKFGVRHAETTDLSRYEAAVLLTGPFNPLYGDSAFDSYRRLARFRGRVAYAQWDVALPFHFNAMASPKAAKLAGVQHDAVTDGKAWFILAQTSEADLRTKASKSVGYHEASFRWVRCLFELEELRRPVHDTHTRPVPAVGYLGSDRPGRLRELRRWFGSETAPPMHLFGRWAPKSIQEITGDVLISPVEYRGMVPEAQVAKTLNAYAATMYLADPAYVKTDFIAQRLFENVTAGVPVLYSDHLQPTVATIMPREWVCTTNDELKAKWRHILEMTTTQRRRRVREHAEVVQQFARSRTDTMAAALREVFG